ncbi:MAG: hypothetical protein KJO07_06360 [Deltaproteobacteria bacterium]|nr:hypothetical protein [Deltaproteobacteria bacterium]
MMRTTGLVMLAVAGLVACEAEPPQAPVFVISIDTVTDTGEPLAGVQVSSKKTALGTSKAKGRVRTKLRGREGLRLPITVVCPDGYRPEEGGDEVVLKTLKTADGKVAPVSSRVVCVPTERIAALVVKTAPKIPVKVQGKVVATTNADGVAHAALRFAPNTTFRVELDTSEQPSLRPRSPVTTLTVLKQDEVFPIAFEFKKDAPKPTRKRPKKRTKKRPFKPERID